MSSYHGKRPSRETACYGKSPFATYKLADEAARRMRQNIKGCAVEAYRCPHCCQYHTGKAHKSRKRAAIAMLADKWCETP